MKQAIFFVLLCIAAAAFAGSQRDKPAPDSEAAPSGGGGANAADEREEAGAVEEAPQPRGTLVIVGGGATPAEATRRFVERAGGAESARIFILPMAHSDETLAEYDAGEFRRAGADAQVFTLTRDEAQDAGAAERIKAATGIWFSGGQQRDLMAVLHDTPAAEAIRQRYREGGVVGGSSAGAAVMSALMIVGGERRPSATPTSDTGTYETIERDNILVSEGLGLLEGAVVDQHFLRRRRHNRLVSVVLEHPDLLGVGIDESTALIVSPDGSWEVLGDGQVMVFDAREARVTAPDAPKLGAAGLRLEVLPPGSRFDPQTGDVVFPGDDKNR